MKIDQLIAKFSLSSLPPSSHLFRFNGSVKQSAVLIAIVENSDGANVILTKRATHLRHHGGQISFPGGKVDDNDSSFVAAALREAQEEISLAPEYAEIIGYLHPYQTITGFVIHPVIAKVPADIDLAANPDEVAEVFQVPLSHILNLENHVNIYTQHKNKRYPVTFIPYQHHNIWGATAAILRDLAIHLQ